MPKPEPTGARPLRNAKHEAYAQLIASGKYTQIDAYILVFPGAAKWKPAAAYVKASVLADKVEIRTAHLKERAAKAVVMDLAERRKILTRIAREVGNHDPGDYLEGGADGAYISFGKESPNRLAVQGIKSRTIMEGEGDGAQAAVITEIRLRPTSEAVAAIDTLNKMDGVYKSEAGDQLATSLAQLVDAITMEDGFGPAHLRKHNTNTGEKKT